MGQLNLDLIKKKLQALQTGENRNKNVWKPEAGENRIRICPYQFNKENPFIELYFHYDLGKKSYLSLYTFGEPDPIMEFADKLKSIGTKEDWVLGKKMEPKLRVFVPIVVRGNEKEGVKFWGFGKEIYQSLLDIMVDPDYGDITDPINGRDVIVDYKTPKEVGNTYGKISVRVKPVQSKVTEDREIAEKIVHGQINILDIFPKPTYEELKKALEKWLNPEADSDENVDAQIELARQKGGKVKPEVDEVEDEESNSKEDIIIKEEDIPSPKKPIAKKPAAPEVAKETSKVENDFDELFK